MSATAGKYGLLTQTSGVEKTQDPKFQKHLPISAVFGWLGAGWRDLARQPVLSLFYGFLVFAVSVVVVWTMFTLGWDYVLFPALSGFMIIGPVFAVGLYEKSRALEDGRKTSLDQMLFARSKSGAQVLFAGVLLALLMLLWMRAAVLLYALFFGYRAFPGFEHMLGLLVGSPAGWGLLVTGSAVGGLFAALGFALSAFSIPMLLNERSDAITAMGLSFKLVWNNLPVMLAWGAVVLLLMALSLATALVGLIIVFPLLGHATWHAYKAIR
ncbi:DUF2189 domain-containing protein [Devosia sp. PTR5]|uniref:DUF2189 domain-containing protein n=1 Tax=Devosia oryzisoli TaxID=2774138 RepID=A0A927IUU5_9HYPH|nr:DUF2189 domain-containing protein [Devosia oryzisoli]MBD8067233.1 DUF2189 domain-containing protein [Devosia oryzisoli]